MARTILITGSTDGIGKLAAVKLAKEGHEVFLHGRNAGKLERVISEVKKIANNENIHGFVADFSDLCAVKQMAAQINKKLSKLDVLINNAGVYKSSVAIADNGLDMRFVVNYLAPFILTEELIPALKKGNAPRVINLSSAAQAPVSLDALAGKLQLSTHESYAQSKLALTMWSFYLAETEQDVNVIAVNPGSLLDTRMVREGFGRVWSPADKGANILYDLAISKQYEDASGKYFDNDIGAFGTAHASANNREAIYALIEGTKQSIVVS